MGLMWARFRVWYPNGLVFVLFFQFWYPYGSKFLVGTPRPISRGRTPPGTNPHIVSYPKYIWCAKWLQEDMHVQMITLQLIKVSSPNFAQAWFRALSRSSLLMGIIGVMCLRNKSLITHYQWIGSNRCGHRQSLSILKRKLWTSK